MMRKRIGRLMSARAKALLLTTTVVASLAIMALASPALATPKGEFAIFADCPLATPELNLCLYAKTESGSFTIGKKTVPIVTPQILQGGLKENEVPPSFLEFIAAADGNTLPKTPQKVPGGLSGLVNCTEIKGSGLIEKALRASCEAIFENKVTGVNASVELAGPAKSIEVNLGALLSATGTALSLPAKVHLENPLLGSSCYVGSNSAPVVIKLTTGTTSPPLPNKPITGKVGELVFTESGIIQIKNNSLVNNSFAAPATNGCGGIFEFLLGPIINSQLGVPSAAGTNTAILNGTLQQTSAENVKAHE
jgi:hypothetical protein